MQSGSRLPAAWTVGITLGATLAFAALRMTGQTTQTGRAGDRHPNLNGIWQVTTTANWDLLAHAMRPAVGQPGVYPDIPVLAAPATTIAKKPGDPCWLRRF